MISVPSWGLIRHKCFTRLCLIKKNNLCLCVCPSLLSFPFQIGWKKDEVIAAKLFQGRVTFFWITCALWNQLPYVFPAEVKLPSGSCSVIVTSSSSGHCCHKYKKQLSDRKATVERGEQKTQTNKFCAVLKLLNITDLSKFVCKNPQKGIPGSQMLN